MSRSTPNMGLTVWNQTNDLFDHSILAANFDEIDGHDHSNGKGTQVGNAGLQDASITFNKIAPSLFANFVPTGGILAYAGATAPTGFLMCDAVQYPQFNYSALYGVIGNAFGAASPGFFAVPNLQQRIPIGRSGSGVTANLGASGGSIQHVHTVPGLPIPGLAVPGLSVPGLFVQNLPIPSLTVNPHRHVLSGQGAVQLGIGSHSGNTALIGQLSGVGNFTGQQWFDNHAWGFDGSGQLAQGFGLWGWTDQWVESFGGTANTQSSTTGGATTSSGTTGAGTTGTSVTGSGTSGQADPPYLVINYIIKY